MQVKDQRVIHRDKYSILGSILKGVVTLACLYFIWSQFEEQEIDFSSIEWPTNTHWILVAITLLMLINWYLEALRWKISISTFENITLKNAWHTVLSGLALNWVLPFTSGDFVARLEARKNKYQTTSAIILNRGVMLFLTIVYGVFSLFFIEQSIIQINWLYVAVFPALFLILYLFRRKLSEFLSYFKEIKNHVLISISLMSVIRYAVFTFQFYWLLSVFNSELLPIILIAGIGWIFFVRSVIPHLLGGIGLREAASIVFFSSFVTDLSSVLIPVFIIWVVNTVIPSIAGLVFIWRTKWSRA